MHAHRSAHSRVLRTLVTLWNALVGGTVKIRLYGTLGHFLAPVPEMHSCGSMHGSCPESLAIVPGSAKIAAGGSFQTLSIVHSETKTGLSAFCRSPREATKYLWKRI